jgi:hypothetical protein
VPRTSALVAQLQQKIRQIIRGYKKVVQEQQTMCAMALKKKKTMEGINGMYT